MYTNLFRTFLQALLSLHSIIALSVYPSLKILAPKFWLALHRTKVRWRFRKISWPSQNIWTLHRIFLWRKLNWTTYYDFYHLILKYIIIFNNNIKKSNYYLPATELASCCEKDLPYFLYRLKSELSLLTSSNLTLFCSATKSKLGSETFCCWA